MYSQTATSRRGGRPLMYPTGGGSVGSTARFNNALMEESEYEEKRGKWKVGKKTVLLVFALALVAFYYLYALEGAGGPVGNALTVEGDTADTMVGVKADTAERLRSALAHSGHESAPYAAALVVAATEALSAGHVEMAQERLREAIGIRERVLGRDRMAVAAPLFTLGKIIADQGNVEGSLPLLERARNIFHDKRGPLHTDYAHALIVIGGVHSARGDFDKAFDSVSQGISILRGATLTGHSITHTAIKTATRIISADHCAKSRQLVEKAVHLMPASADNAVRASARAAMDSLKDHCPVA